MSLKDLAGKKLEEGKRFAVEKATDAGPRFRELLAIEDDRPLSPEKFLLLLVAAVHDDNAAAISITELRDDAKKQERLAAAAGMVPGPLGFVADMYCDTTVVCDMVECFGLQLHNDDIAAHLLSMWNVMPDFPTARRAIDLEDDMSITKYAAERLQTQVKSMTKRDTIQLLWQLRSHGLPMPTFSPTTYRNVVFPKRALNERFFEAAAELGIPQDQVRGSGWLSRLGRKKSVDAVTPAVTAIRATAANWYPDPFGRFDHRYHDGFEWTDHVSRNGQTMSDPPVTGPSLNEAAPAAAAFATEPAASEARLVEDAACDAYLGSAPSARRSTGLHSSYDLSNGPPLSEG